MEEKISVVVPVYNVEKYLPKCLDSLVNQTYSNIQIILVDDASPDGCGRICDEYADRDPRIRVVHREKNGGLSCARNDGIDMAEGAYIMFVDSDDWVSEDACATLLCGLKEYGADCCAGRCVVVLDHEGQLVPREDVRRGTHCDTAYQAMANVLMNESSACNRLYPRKVFEQLRFQAGRVNEDEPLVLRAYSEMEKIVFLDADTYYYRKRPNSITTSRFSLKMLDCVSNSLENLEFVRERKPELIPCAEYKYMKTMLWCYVNLGKVKDEEREQARKQRRKLRSDIRGSRKTALKNKYLSIPLKVLALWCSL